MDALQTITRLLEQRKYKLLIISIGLMIIVAGMIAYINFRLTKQREQIVEEVVDHFNVQALRYDQATKVRFSLTDAEMERVNSLLDDMRISVNAINVFVFIDHNGFTTPDGIHFKFSSCIFERPKYPREYSYLYIRNLPASVFASWRERFMKQGVVYYPDLDSLKNTDYATFAMFHADGVKSIIFLPFIRSDAFDIAGFIGVTFDRVTTFEPECWEMQRLRYRRSNVVGVIYNMRTRGGSAYLPPNN